MVNIYFYSDPSYSAGQVDRISVHDWDDGDFSRRSYDVTRVLADNIVHLPFGPVTSLSYGNGLTLNRITGVRNNWGQSKVNLE